MAADAGSGAAVRATGLGRLFGDPAVRGIVANGSWLLAARGINIPLALLETVLVARLLGATGYGELGVVMTVVLLTQRALSFRMNELVVKYLTDALAAGRRTLAAATLKASLLAEGATSVAAFAIAAGAATWTARYFVAGAEAAPTLRLFALVILGTAVSESTVGVLQVFNRFPAQAAINLLRKTLVLAAVAVSALGGASVARVAAAYALALTATGLCQAVIAWREADRRLGRGWWRTPLAELRGKRRQMARFAFATNLGATLALLARESDVLWVAYFRGPTEAGYYKLAVSLLKAPFAVGGPMTRAFYPEIARALARRAWDPARMLLKRSTVLASMWVVPAAAAVLLFSSWVVRTFHGADFLPAVPAMWILLIGFSAGQLFFWARPTILALGRPEFALKITTLKTVLKVVLALALLPRFGYLAQAAIFSFIHVLETAPTLVFVHRQLARRRAGGRP